VNVFPKTRAAAGYAARHGPGELTRARAVVLLARQMPSKTSCPAATATRPPPSAACCATWCWLPVTWPARPGCRPAAMTPTWPRSPACKPPPARRIRPGSTRSAPGCCGPASPRQAPPRTARPALPAPGSQHPAAGTAPAPGRNAHRAVSEHRADIQQLSSLSSGFPGTGMAPGIPLTGCPGLTVASVVR